MLISHEELTSDRPCDVVTTSGDIRCRVDAKQTGQNLHHPASDRKLSDNSSSAPRGRGKGGARNKAKRSKNRSGIGADQANDGWRSKGSPTHEPANYGSSASTVKCNWTSRLNDRHHAADTDRFGNRRHGRESHGTNRECGGSYRGLSCRVWKPEHRGTGGEYSRKTASDASHTSVRNSCEELNVSEDWEAELCRIPSSGCNVTIATNTPHAVVTTSGVKVSVAAKGNENQMIC